MAAASALELMTPVDTVVASSRETFPVGEKIWEAVFVIGIETIFDIFLGIIEVRYWLHRMGSVIAKAVAFDDFVG